MSQVSDNPLPSVDVTPQNPLIISSPVPGYNVVNIIGGTITVLASVKMTITTLKKMS